LVFTIRTPKDLPALQLEYMRRLNDGFDGELVVQIEGPVAPGGWSLHPDRAALSQRPTIDVILRGAKDAIIDAPSEIFARRLSIEQVQLRLPEIRARWTVSHSAHLTDVVVADGRGSSMDGHGTLLTIEAWGPEGGAPNPAEARLERCWFLRNFADPKGMILLAFDTTKGRRAYWDRVSLTEGGFLGNVLATDLQITGAREVIVRDSLWVRGRADGVLIRPVSTAATTVHNSRLVMADRNQLTAHGPDSPDITLTDGTQIIAAKPPTGSTTGYTAPISAHRTHAQWPQHADASALVGTWNQPVDRAALSAARVRLLAAPGAP
jgi:hypothetical protein